MEKLIENICNSYKNEHFHRIDSSEMPSRKIVIQIIEQIKQVLFPGYFAEPGLNKTNIKYFIGELLNEIRFSLAEQIRKAYHATNNAEITKKKCDIISLKLLKKLPEIRELLKLDIQAAFTGDPAAKHIPDIIISYPCLDVITAYRVAHQLFKAEIPLIPRMITEHIHSKTGVDIHPGAKIGSHFFIDHGTGVVIGETTIIGNNVKIYQGVTLGALSFPKDKKGEIIKGLKRHPTIEDNVTIYANATILGGKTVIGKGAIIGGNTWITESISPFAKVK